jgi:hypothetical protein
VIYRSVTKLQFVRKLNRYARTKSFIALLPSLLPLPKWKTLCVVSGAAPLSRCRRDAGAIDRYDRAAYYVPPHDEFLTENHVPRVLRFELWSFFFIGVAVAG